MRNSTSLNRVLVFSAAFVSVAASLRHGVVDEITQRRERARGVNLQNSNAPLFTARLAAALDDAEAAAASQPYEGSTSDGSPVRVTFQIDVLNYLPADALVVDFFLTPRPHWFLDPLSEPVIGSGGTMHFFSPILLSEIVAKWKTKTTEVEKSRTSFYDNPIYLDMLDLQYGERSCRGIYVHRENSISGFGRMMSQSRARLVRSTQLGLTFMLSVDQKHALLQDGACGAANLPAGDKEWGCSFLPQFKCRDETAEIYEVIRDVLNATKAPHVVTSSERAKLSEWDSCACPHVTPHSSGSIAAMFVFRECSCDIDDKDHNSTARERAHASLHPGAAFQVALQRFIARPNWHIRQQLRQVVQREGARWSNLRDINGTSCAAMHIRHGDVLLDKWFVSEHRASMNLTLEQYATEGRELLRSPALNRAHTAPTPMAIFYVTDDSDIVDEASTISKKLGVELISAPLDSDGSLSKARGVKGGLAYSRLAGHYWPGMKMGRLADMLASFQISSACHIWVGHCHSHFGIGFLLQAASLRNKLPWVSDFGSDSRSSSPICKTLSKTLDGTLGRRCTNPCTIENQCDKLGPAPRVCESISPTGGDLWNSLSALKLRNDWVAMQTSSALGKSLEAQQYDVWCAEPLRVIEYGMGGHNGMGSDLHTFAKGLCGAFSANAAFATVANEKHGWIWEDKVLCSDSERKAPLACYFNLPTVCPRQHNTETLPMRSRQKVTWPFGSCENVVPKTKPSRAAFRAAAMEYLFAHLNPRLVEEAEKEISSTFGARGIPRPLIAVHIRWGDKGSEMKLVPIESYINAVAKLVAEHRLGDVHVFVTTEDPNALSAFCDGARATPGGSQWSIYAYKKAVSAYSEMHSPWRDAADGGRMGLYSMVSLLFAMEAKYYVLTTGSNWSRLINELRTNLIDAHACQGVLKKHGPCTHMADLRPDPNGWW
jgi:hypothetical protein